MSFTTDPRSEHQLRLAAFRDEVEAVYDRQADLLVDKRDSYGADNLTADGRMGMMIRTSDKIARLRHMYKNQRTEGGDGESELDAWMDVLGYATLALIDIEAERQRDSAKRMSRTMDDIGRSISEGFASGCYGGGNIGNAEGAVTVNASRAAEAVRNWTREDDDEDAGTAGASEGDCLEPESCAGIEFFLSPFGPVVVFTEVIPEGTGFNADARTLASRLAESIRQSSSHSSGQ